MPAEHVKALALMLLFVAMQAADVAITIAGISKGVMREANPIMEPFIHSFWAAFGVKMLMMPVFVAVLAWWQHSFKRWGWTHAWLYGLCGFMAVVLVNNTIIYYV